MKNDRVYITHILECIEKIEQYTASGKEVFFNSPLIQDAVIRNLEIIGEATKNISDTFREENHQIPWKQMAALRDVLIHDYMGVDLQIVWNVLAKELPSVKEKMINI